MTWEGEDRRTVNGELKQVAQEAGREGAKEVLELLGADVSSPIDMQQDFAHLRQHRVAKDAMGKVVKRAAVGTLVTAGVGTAFLLLKDNFFR